EYRQLGKSGIRISVPILRCAGFENPSRIRPWWNDAICLLTAAYDRVINTWDAADVYSNRISETTMVKIIKKYQICRKKVILMKISSRAMSEDRPVQTIMPVEKSKDHQNTFVLLRAAIFNAFEAWTTIVTLLRYKQNARESHQLVVEQLDTGQL
ncbi:hypothetical protein LZ30DRAFT_789600, partial [Colletotrichum cereale]